MTKFSHISKKLRQFVLTVVVLGNYIGNIYLVFLLGRAGMNGFSAITIAIIVFFSGLQIQAFSANVLGVREFYNETNQTIIDTLRKIISPRQ